MQNLEQIQTGQLGRYCIPLGHGDSGKQINTKRFLGDLKKLVELISLFPFHFLLFQLISHLSVFLKL